jgi:hypothetical protein
MTTTRPSRLQGYRQRRDEFMRTNEHSPLSESQRANFVPLDYFEERPDLVFVVDVDKDVPTDPVELPTTTGTTKEYVPYGRVTFEVDGQPATLMVYREPQRGRLIAPFRDTTCGNEVYGAARRQADARLQLRLRAILSVQRQLGLHSPADGELAAGTDPRRRKALSRQGIVRTLIGLQINYAATPGSARNEPGVVVLL